MVVVSEEATANTSDKWLTCQFFCLLNVPTARCRLPAKLHGADWGCRLFIKPRFGRPGKGASEVRDERELAFFLNYVPHPIVQQYLPGPPSRCSSAKV